MFPGQHHANYALYTRHVARVALAHVPNQRSVVRCVGQTLFECRQTVGNALVAFNNFFGESGLLVWATGHQNYHAGNRVVLGQQVNFRGLRLQLDPIRHRGRIDSAMRKAALNHCHQQCNGKHHQAKCQTHTWANFHVQ